MGPLRKGSSIPFKSPRSMFISIQISIRIYIHNMNVSIYTFFKTKYILCKSAINKSEFLKVLMHRNAMKLDNLHQGLEVLGNNFL